MMVMMMTIMMTVVMDDNKVIQQHLCTVCNIILNMFQRSYNQKIEDITACMCIQV